MADLKKLAMGRNGFQKGVGKGDPLKVGKGGPKTVPPSKPAKTLEEASAEEIGELEAAFRDRLAKEDSGVLLSPYDVALLIIERGSIDPDDAETAKRIDALLAGHERASMRQKPKPLAPVEAHRAMVEAWEFDNAPDAEQRRRERLAELMRGLPEVA